MCPDDEVWVADAEGNPLPQGEVGRLMTRGPYTFRGYYKSPRRNASAFDANGFYCSGDLISIDPEGYITVQGREKIRSTVAARYRCRRDRKPVAAPSSSDLCRTGEHGR